MKSERKRGWRRGKSDAWPKTKVSVCAERVRDARPRSFVATSSSLSFSLLCALNLMPRQC